MNPDFSHDDVLAKMDALLRKHQDAQMQAPVVVDFPLLTEVVEAPVEEVPVLTEVIESDAATPEEAREAHGPMETPAVNAVPPGCNDEILAQLEQQIRPILEQRLPFHIVEAVDKALPVVLEEFSMQLENLVREAVARELDRRLPELLKAVSQDASRETE